MFPMLAMMSRGETLSEIDTPEEKATFRVGRDNTIQMSYDYITVDGIFSYRYRGSDRYDDRRTMTCRLMIEISEQSLTNGRHSRMSFSKPRWCERCWLKEAKIHSELQHPGQCKLVEREML